ncbi:LamG-like jellyroll fold domain-containing protein [Promethearchaeum syntrophicum]|uniref:LamG-like jellyroll fold domain-containing protein n=1 Tax=Promethearchaeum syntrophicum TaxID=2594042 RepID=A0A5B9DBJ6_9ARCH|nr:LamG-like jellyroll fold domain-containing protein [Candidatus Prometheoarchaeum syntrophicum]QEE16345.1 Caspase domain protein [Candidatus Prometheoarchaeum syntrophicum]
MKKNTKKSKIIGILAILLLPSILQLIYIESYQKFTSNEINVNLLFDTESENHLANPQIPKTSDYPPYIDNDTIAFCDFNEGAVEYFGLSSHSYAELINPGIEGEQSIIIPYNKQPVSYGISFSNENINITNGTIECYFRPLYIRENSLPYKIMFIGQNPLCEVYLQGNSVFAWHTAERNVSISPTIQSNTTLQLDVTHHIAYSFGEMGQKLYLDGNLVAENSFTGGICNETLSWGLGSNNLRPSAIGVYDMFKISNIQRDSFDDRRASNPSFSSQDLNPRLPSYHIDSDTFLFCGFETGYGIETQTDVFLNDIDRDNYDETGSIPHGIWGDTSFFIGYDLHARYRIGSPYIYSNMSKGTIEVDFMPFYLADDGHDYNILFIDSSDTTPFQLFIRGNYLYAQHKNNTGTASPLLISNVSLTVDTYYHLAYTFGPLGSKLYINDDLVAESNCNFGIGLLDQWIWGFGHTEDIFPAIGVYDNLRISSIQRSNFTDVFKIDPEFSRSSIHQYVPSYNYFDNNTFLLYDYDTDPISLRYGANSIDSRGEIITSGIIDDRSFMLKYDENDNKAHTFLYSDYINSTMDQGTVEFYFHPLYLANDGKEYIVMFITSLDPPACLITIRGEYLYAQHSYNNGQKSPLLKSNIKLEMGQTYHIAYTFGENGSFLYINGQLESSSECTFGIGTPSHWLWALGYCYYIRLPPAIGIYDFFRISMNQRTNFSTRPPISTVFSSDDLNPNLPPFPPEPMTLPNPANGIISLDGNESVGYAILCGIRDYPGFSADLLYTENDINDYKSFLRGKLHFQDENIQILLNSQGTISNINQAFADVKSKMDENDYLFFTFSGHGSSSTEVLGFPWAHTFNYADWQPWDMTWDYEVEDAIYTRVHFTSINLQENQDFIYIGDYNNQDFYSTVITGQHTDYWSDWVEASHIYVNLVSDGLGEIEGLVIDKVESVFYCPPFYFHPYDGLENGFSDIEFENLLKGIPGKVISIFDSCFSGAFCRAMQGPNRLLFASCGDQQYALESSSVQNGIFTYEFLMSWDSLYQENMGIPPAFEKVFIDASINVRSRSSDLGYEQNPLKFDYISGDVIVSPYVNVSEISLNSSDYINVVYSSYGLGLGELNLSLYNLENQEYIPYSISDISIYDNKINFTIPISNLADYQCIAINGIIYSGTEIFTDFEYYGDYSTLFSEGEDSDGDGINDYEEFLQGSDPWEISEDTEGGSNNSEISGYGLKFFLIGSFLSIIRIFRSNRKKTRLNRVS